MDKHMAKRIAFYLGLSILEIRTIVMYELWYDYLKMKCKRNTRIMLHGTGSFIVYIKTEDIYVDIEKDVETKFYTSNYESESLLRRGKNEKAIGLMKDELGGKILTEVTALRPKILSYLTDYHDKKKQKPQKSLSRNKNVYLKFIWR